MVSLLGDSCAYFMEEAPGQMYDIGVHLLQLIMGYHIRVQEVSASNAPVIDIDGSYLYRKQQQHLPSATCTVIITYYSSSTDGMGVCN